MNSTQSKHRSGDPTPKTNGAPRCEAEETGTTNEADCKKVTNQPHDYRMLGAGFELAGFTIIPGLIGLALDRWIESDIAYISAFGTLAGFVAGMVHFIRQANSVQTSQADQQSKR